METMENIIMNEEVIEQAMEVVSATPKVSWKAFGKGALVVSAIGAAGYGIYKAVDFLKNKKAAKEEPTMTIDNTKIVDGEYVDEESEE